MVTPIEEQLRDELRVLKDCHNQVCQQLVEEQEKNEKLEVRLKTLLDFVENFTQHVNRLIMAENYRLSVKVQGVNDLLNDLYEAIDENYAKASKRKKEIDIACAYAQLQLITEIIDEVEKI